MAEFCHPEFGCDCSEEIKRLRDALDRIANDKATDDEDVVLGYALVIAIAREALA